MISSQPQTAADAGRIVQRYIDGILQGRIPCGRLQRLCVERHVRDLQEADLRGFTFNPSKGFRAIRFFSLLRHSKGEWRGKPFLLEPWQMFILWVLFGWRRKSDGLRRFRSSFVFLARKNGKSTYAAGVGLYLFAGDNEPGAECYTAATKRDQAIIVHSEAVRMVKASPELRKRIQVAKNHLSIVERDSKFEPLGADSDTTDGLNVHAAVVDEYHAHKTAGMMEVLDTATGARRQPMIFTITTAGEDPDGPCGQLYDYCVKVLEGILTGGEKDDALFIFIAAADPDDKWDDPKTWAKANPNHGVSVKPDDLERKVAKARAIPTAKAEFLRKHLNRWTRGAVEMIDMAAWDACAFPVSEADLEGRECYGGLDLSKTGDLTGIVYIFPPKTDGLWRILPRFWIPEDTAREKEQSDGVPYRAWVDAGLVTMTPGNVTDYGFVRQAINEDNDRFTIRDIAYDPWNASHLAQELTGDGLTMIQFQQSFRNYNEPTKGLLEIIKQRQLAHGGNKVMRWMASNVIAHVDSNGNIKPKKPGPGSPKRIDGIPCTIMALARAKQNPESADVEVVAIRL